jgi:Ca2+-binding EF-hand superfamily protein
MEEHPQSFPRSDFETVMQRVKALGDGKQDSLRTSFIEMDVDGSGYLNEAELEGALTKVGRCRLTL